ncbi:hypothetical protein, partial [Parabacteroides goldsteinii]|uniref:hypothetical protein n=1 Tax=Parabacteroides goldsteinii TaxID=328812 RepID=UPI002672A5D8
SEYREIPYPSETDSFMWKAYKLPVIFRWDRFLIQTGHNSLLAGFFGCASFWSQVEIQLLG